MRNNKKGYGLIELLMVVAVVAMMTPLLFWVYVHGIQSFSTNSRYVQQHYKVIDATQRIRKDIEESASCKVAYDATVEPRISVLRLWIPVEDLQIHDRYIIKTWWLENGELLFNSYEGDYNTGKDEALENTDFIMILDGLDTTAVKTEIGTWYMPTRFEKHSDDSRIVLSIKPLGTNDHAFKNRNVTKPIITEFSVLYKDLIN